MRPCSRRARPASRRRLRRAFPACRHSSKRCFSWCSRAAWRMRLRGPRPATCPPTLDRAVPALSASRPRRSPAAPRILQARLTPRLPALRPQARATSTSRPRRGPPWRCRGPAAWPRTRCRQVYATAAVLWLKGVSGCRSERDRPAWPVQRSIRASQTSRSSMGPKSVPPSGSPCPPAPARPKSLLSVTEVRACTGAQSKLRGYVGVVSLGSASARSPGR
mmetsp:Transcript_26915/g.68403  ORF Transcript_26915/g.68403 Transcript_26915/m.68403 type:complete len:220 (-) Transcript_26915:366-1025(-)